MICSGLQATVTSACCQAGTAELGEEHRATAPAWMARPLPVTRDVAVLGDHGEKPRGVRSTMGMLRPWSHQPWGGPRGAPSTDRPPGPWGRTSSELPPIHGPAPCLSWSHTLGWLLLRQGPGLPSLPPPMSLLCAPSPRLTNILAPSPQTLISLHSPLAKPPVCVLQALPTSQAS